MVLEKPGVGANLHDHLQLRMIYKVSGVKTLNEIYHERTGFARMMLNYALFRRGPLTMAPSQLGIFTRSDPQRERANIQYHVQPLSLERFGEPLHPFPAFTASVTNVHPTSRGFVRLRSADPADTPIISPNYLATDEDRRVAADSIRVTRRIVAQPALAPFKPVEHLPGEQRARRRRKPGESRRRHRHHDLSSGRHGEDGPRQRSDGRGRRAAACYRLGADPGGRCLGDAVDHVGQYGGADHDDRREGRGDDPRRRRAVLKAE